MLELLKRNLIKKLKIKKYNEYHYNSAVVVQEYKERDLASIKSFEINFNGYIEIDYPVKNIPAKNINEIKKDFKDFELVSIHRHKNYIHIHLRKYYKVGKRGENIKYVKNTIWE